MKKITLVTLATLIAIFTLVTTFFPIGIPTPAAFCTDDIANYEYRNRVTGKTFYYTGSSSCKPIYFGFFWYSRPIKTFQ